MRIDAVVLAGGRATRLGGTPKAQVVVGPATLLEHALAATRGAEATAVVGPVPTGAPPDVVVTREDPPFGGPVAGLDAGLRALDRPDAPDRVLVLAVDVPGAAAAAAALHDAAAEHPEADGVHLVHDGRAQWLTGIYRRAALTGALAGLEPHGAPVRRLVAPLRLVAVPDGSGMSDDADTWEDVDRLSARFAAAHDEGGTA
ncbi:molybdenum cofactor guanylyltransferase [Isoptericola aurantiacus]|uniref:molybdenum cofactor guanylyltransferase n=1 Tax=Isoptericola aurantiacus TaxID=3377839 RepID=UPI003839F1D1